MDNTPVIPTRNWILALAIAVGFAFLFVAWEFSEVISGIGILTLSDQKLMNDVATLRQDLTNQQATIEALKASAEKSGSPSPASASSEAAAPSAAVAQPPKAKVRR